jgi:hypothetical protein
MSDDVDIADLDAVSQAVRAALLDCEARPTGYTFAEVVRTTRVRDAALVAHVVDFDLAAIAAAHYCDMHGIPLSVESLVGAPSAAPGVLQ